MARSFHFFGLFVTVFSSCNLLIEQRTVQCSTDADCTKFGTHPYCQAGVCVPSGLGPEGCVYNDGRTLSQTELLNACSVSKTQPVDNCQRFQMCDGQEPPLVDPPAGGAPAKLVTTAVLPTVSCRDAIERPNVLYLMGANPFAPMLPALAKQMRANSPSITLVFQSNTSCKGVDAIFSATASKHLMKDDPGNPDAGTAANYAWFYAPDGTKTPCLLDSGGNQVDIGVSQIDATNCDPTYASMPNIGRYAGPINSAEYFVPAASTQRVISAEAARLVFGVGGSGTKAAPWVDPNFYFIRNPFTAIHVLTGKASGVPHNKFWGVDRQSLDNIRDSMMAVEPASAEKAIGVLFSDFVETNRANLRTLYFQARGQSVAYLPNSSPESFDKANVRDGHYPIWGSLYFYAPLTSGVPPQQSAAFLNRISVPRLELDVLNAVIDAHFVPNCAMKVSRTVEMGDMAPNTADFQCHCYFETRTASGKVPTHCVPCDTSADCPSTAPSCNYNFCEAR